MNGNRAFQTLPVCLFKTCRVESLQQEMGDDVEGIFVRFVEHVPETIS